MLHLSPSYKLKGIGCWVFYHQKFIFYKSELGNVKKSSHLKFIRKRRRKSQSKCTANNFQWFQKHTQKIIPHSFFNCAVKGYILKYIFCLFKKKKKKLSCQNKSCLSNFQITGVPRDVINLNNCLSAMMTKVGQFM